MANKNKDISDTPKLLKSVNRTAIWGFIVLGITAVINALAKAGVSLFISLLPYFQIEPSWYLVSFALIVALIRTRIRINISTDTASSDLKVAKALNLVSEGTRELKPEVIKTAQRELDFGLENIDKFKDFLNYALRAWALFYFLKLIYFGLTRDIFGLDIINTTSVSKWFDFAFNFLNVANSSFLFLCYYVLSFKTSKDDQKISNRPLKFKVADWAVNLIIAFVVIFVLGSLLTYHLCKTQTYTDVEHLVVLAIPQLFIGIVSGVVLGLLTGRLDSKFIKTKPKFILMLYCYAIAQTAYPLVELAHSPEIPSDIINNIVFTLTLTIMAVAILGKVALIVILYRSNENSSLYLYFLRLRIYNGISDLAISSFHNVLRFHDPSTSEYQKMIAERKKKALAAKRKKSKK